MDEPNCTMPFVCGGETFHVVCVYEIQKNKTALQAVRLGQEVMVS